MTVPHSRTSSPTTRDMKFVNTKNGVVMDMPEDFSGSNWEPVEVPKTPHRTETEEKAEPKKATKKKKEV